MDDEQYAARIAALGGYRDTEEAHCEADDILIEILRAHGYNKTADAFEALDKWYA